MCLINQVRAVNGLTPLYPEWHLQRAAERHDNHMIVGDYFAHRGPAGDTPVGRIFASGYPTGTGDRWVLGENIAWGTFSASTPRAIVRAWLASPGHLENILRPCFSATGLAVEAAVPDADSHGAPGATYTEDFGGALRS